MLFLLLLRQRLMTISLLLLFLAVSTQRVSARQEVKALEPGDLELVISGPRTDSPNRGPLEFHPRRFKATLINHSSRSVVYGPNSPAAVIPYTMTDWRVSDAKGKPVPIREMYICRVGAPTRLPIRAISDENLFLVGPGESRDLGENDLSAWFELSEPGEYKIYREFSFSPPRLSQVTIAGGFKFPAQYDVSAMSPEKRQKLRDATGFTLKSNVWTLVIK